jgi:hypothetical protein
MAFATDERRSGWGSAQAQTLREECGSARRETTTGPRKQAFPRGIGREDGVVLIWAVLASVIVAGGVVTALDSQRATDRSSLVTYQVDGQARAVASAGIVDALAWFRRQQAQPVRDFAPRRVLVGLPEQLVNETDDSAVGLVREYEISPGLWGRYEVRKARPPEPFVDSNRNGIYDVGELHTDLNGDRKWSCPQGTRDVSLLRGLTGGGWVWYLESVGLVFARDDLTQPLGVGRNRLVASYRLSTEIRRLTLSLPAQAAINARTGGLVQLGRGSQVWAPQTGVAVGTAAVRITVSPLANVEAPLASVDIPDYKDDFASVFSLDLDLLKAVSDIVGSDTSGISGRIPDFSLVTLIGDVTFDRSNPLLGTGIVVVQGDVTIQAGSNSYFRGLLYVDGNLRIDAPALVRGSIICTGLVQLGGANGDVTRVEHDPELIDELLRRIGQYRHSKVLFPTCRVLPDGRPEDS